MEISSALHKRIFSELLPAQPAFGQFIKVMMATFKLRKLRVGLRVIVGVVVTIHIVMNNLHDTDQSLNTIVQ
jgi:hypothetical protein